MGNKSKARQRKNKKTRKGKHFSTVIFSKLNSHCSIHLFCQLNIHIFEFNFYSVYSFHKTIDNPTASRWLFTFLFFFLSIPLVYYFVWNPNLFLFRLCAQRKTPAKITFVVWMFYKKSPFPLSFNNFTNLITQYERRSINIKVLLSPKRPASTIDVIVHFDSLRVSPYSKLLIEQKISTHISSLSEESNECLFSLIPFYCKYVLTSWPQLRITWKLISFTRNLSKSDNISTCE